MRFRAILAAFCGAAVTLAPAWDARSAESEDKAVFTFDVEGGALWSPMKSGRRDLAIPAGLTLAVLFPIQRRLLGGFGVAFASDRGGAFVTLGVPARLEWSAEKDYRYPGLSVRIGTRPQLMTVVPCVEGSAEQCPRGLDKTEFAFGFLADAGLLMTLGKFEVGISAQAGPVLGIALSHDKALDGFYRGAILAVGGRF
ncbi:MAG: hypothetical protein HY898_29175 [Deltaproteobacteria bacterium]|nr:hypothetical protein [Deltaproteobacteria bacterium]